MSAIILAFADSREGGRKLAACVAAPCADVVVHRFPDRESLVRIPQSAEVVVLFRSLDDPNGKLIELILAASAARDGGARRVVLVAPYLAYMRQDVAFHPGEAVSQRVIGRLLAEHFDALITVDPHLHRIATLSEAVPGIPAIALSASALLSQAIDPGENPVVVGPDSESLQWTRSIAEPLGLDILQGSKERHGDRDVTVAIGGIDTVHGRPVVLVDDVISSGETLMKAAARLREAGVARIDALATHCLASTTDLARMKDSGISRIISSDSIAGPTAHISLAPLLSAALEREGLLQS